MRILGVDPGLEVTGYGLIDTQNGSTHLVEAGVIRSKPRQPLPERLGCVSQALQDLLTQRRPDLVVVEDLYSHYKTPKPAILMGHVRGVVLSAAALKKIPVVSVLPTHVKKVVVGQGHASKLQVARMVQMRLGLEGRQVPSDVTDALAAALAHADRMRKPKEVTG
ncbi:MAG: crossover junction endodeoxyribonuclease RuvC [Candidatus Omnitrophica bacterium]|nr:crossover junction endodeoxyribonuclease RuvC [Candidatus Omnitrophota bacterium]